MCPILAGVPRTVAESFDNEHTSIADVARVLIVIRDPKARSKQRLKAFTTRKPRTGSLRSTDATSSHAVVLKLSVNSHS